MEWGGLGLGGNRVAELELPFVEPGLRADETTSGLGTPGGGGFGMPGGLGKHERRGGERKRGDAAGCHSRVYTVCRA